MAALTWDSDPVAAGLEKVVLFPPGTPGVPWNGFAAIDGKDPGSSTTLYFDGQAFANYVEQGSFSAAIEAITYPDILDEIQEFGLSWRETLDDGYRIHLIWGVTAVPTSTTSSTRAGDVNLSTFGWGISTRSVDLEGSWPVSHLILDVDAMPPLALQVIESLLYGHEGIPSQLPDPEAILEIFWAYPLVKITDNRDGTFTAEGDEQYIRNLGNGLYEIESGGIEFVDADTFTITTW